MASTPVSPAQRKQILRVIVISLLLDLVSGRRELIRSRSIWLNSL